MLQFNLAFNLAFDLGQSTYVNGQQGEDALQNHIFRHLQTSVWAGMEITSSRNQQTLLVWYDMFLHLKCQMLKPENKLDQGLPFTAAQRNYGTLK